MKILLLGASGQVGQELQRLLPVLGETRACNRKDMNLIDFNAIRTTVAAFQPDCVVNAAAYTAVDKAESEPELAHRVNAEAVGVLAEEAKKSGAWLIHYSTDYVFDGTKTSPYTELDAPNPINVYGHSKWAGEQAIEQSGCKHLVFRTSWVIGAQGANFAKTILRLAQERTSLGVVDDQTGAPTTSGLIAQVTQAALEAFNTGPWPQGLYHLAPQGQTTWYGVAQALLEIAENSGLRLAMEPSALYPIKTVSYPTSVKRPFNSRLATQKLESMLDFELLGWRCALVDVAKEIIKDLESA